MSDTPHGILPVRFERWVVSRLDPVVATLARMGLTPNALTLLSLVFGLGAATLVVYNQLRWGVMVLILAGGCDILDGQVAHFTGKVSRFGGILDSALDRYIEFLILGSVGIHYFQTGQPGWILVCAFALAGSFMVSYVKARAEGAGLSCPVGLLQRAERLVILGTGIFFGGWLLKSVLLALALLAHVTAVERLMFLKKSSGMEVTR
jgi:CDP-diacylglycerol---glycerol-3-phosphate 3-phosphatidyltransferase